MPIRFGDHSNDQGVSIEPGMYNAIISTAALVMENDQPKVNDNGKKQVDVFFTIDENTKLRRRFPIGYGQNKATSQWAMFSKMLEAATGIKCGDPAQRDVSDDDLVGCRVRIVVEVNDRGYSDVSNIMPPAAARPKPQKAAEPAPLTEEEEESIPF